MALYCGVVLHSRDCWLAILDDRLKVVREAKVGNDLEAIVEIRRAADLNRRRNEGDQELGMEFLRGGPRNSDSLLRWTPQT